MRRDDDFDEDDETGIEVRTWVFPLYWTLYFAKPKVSIDREESTVGWGTFFFPLRPGKYVVEVWTPYLVFPRYMSGSELVKVEPGRVVRVNYEIKPFFFGSPLSVEKRARRRPRERDFDDED